MATLAQRAHALTNYYEKAYAKVYGHAPVINRYSAKWGWEAILASLSDKEARELVDYYLTVARPGHPLDWFFYNYDKLALARRETLEDSERRKKLRQESQRRAEEWRSKVGNKGITGY